MSGVVHKPLPHESAHKHVSGRATYTDDIVEPTGLLHAYLGLSTRAHARVTGIDLDPVRNAPGVIDIITLADVPGHTDISPVGAHDEPLFATDEVMFWGQPLFAVIAETRDQARRAARLARVTYDDLPAAISIDEAEAAGGELVTAPLTLERGNVEKAFKSAPNIIEGEMEIGGQEHFYLEGHIAMAEPGEDGDMLVHSSTQHPSEIQHMVAHVLGVNSAAVTVKVRRMGGGFGGKETQGSLFACVAALAARRLGRAVKIRPDRDDDMSGTGKRHDFKARYKLGFDNKGRVLAVDATFAARGGMSADLTGPVTDRALFHADNAYYYPAVLLKSKPLRTNTVSNTAYRGFGGPQGLIGGERFMEEIAYSLGMDPLDVRKANFYGTEDRNVTPYHQKVTDNIIERVVEELEASSDYRKRRQAIVDFNAKGGVIRKGIALTPVKFGISFTATFYNQAGALIHVYRDGSIHLNHGGTEMGQGLNMKVAQVVADVFGVGLDQISITATQTDKVPNTSATAASSGSDLNGKAAQNAARKIRSRLVKFAAKRFKVKERDVRFANGFVLAGDEELSFADLCDKAYFARVQLSATGFYKTPNIHWDREKGMGRPFFYFAYGASVSEVSVDLLTGEYQVDRVDILHDVGKSLNPAIDLGQVEGAFVQGMGWLTTEELVWDDKGQLRTHAPSTYKIPLASDVPRQFNVQLAEWSVNPERSIKRSKAVGEPPFMLAVSVVEALSMAVASVAGYRVCPRLDVPATPERVLMTAERLRREAGA
ncbi:MAG: xanthine dehydrogenase molybdopterin binding subunit [Hyphomicrobiaceae bacterium]|nr:xanthine dehydrogenase molybdopterin binding subunit [Hyphomicrobiaceae bacterium]